MVGERDYDLIIVGGGPGGLTAGLYTARANLRALLLACGWSAPGVLFPATQAGAANHKQQRECARRSAPRREDQHDDRCQPRRVRGTRRGHHE